MNDFTTSVIEHSSISKTERGHTRPVFIRLARNEIKKTREFPAYAKQAGEVEKQ